MVKSFAKFFRVRYISKNLQHVFEVELYNYVRFPAVAIRIKNLRMIKNLSKKLIIVTIQSNYNAFSTIFNNLASKIQKV